MSYELKKMKHEVHEVRSHCSLQMSCRWYTIDRELCKGIFREQRRRLYRDPKMDRRQQMLGALIMYYT
jgi:hypothetical protein